MELLSADTAAAVATAFPCLRALRLVAGENAAELAGATEGLTLLLQGVEGSPADEDISECGTEPAGTDGEAGQEATAGASGSAPVGLPRSDGGNPLQPVAASSPWPTGEALSRFPGAVASGLLSCSPVPLPLRFPPALTCLHELCLSGQGQPPPTHMATLLALASRLPALTRLELSGELGAVVHVCCLRQLTRLQALVLECGELRVGGDPHGLTALAALTRLEVGRLANKRPPLQAGAEGPWVQHEQAWPLCALPPRLSELALRNVREDGRRERPHAIRSVLMDLLGLTSTPSLTRLDLTGATGAGDLYAHLLSRLTGLQQLVMPDSDLVLHPGISQLAGLTQLVARNMYVSRMAPAAAQAAHGAILVAPGAWATTFSLPPRLPQLTLARSGDGPWLPLQRVARLDAGPHFTRLELTGSAGDSALSARALAGLVGLRELVAPGVDLEGPAGMSALTALTLLRVRRLLHSQPQHAGLHQYPWMLPPSLELLWVDAEVGGAGDDASRRSMLSVNGCGYLESSQGPTRLHVSGPCPGFLCADAVRGLTGLQKLEAPGSALRIGRHGFTALTALTSMWVGSIEVEASEPGSDLAQGEAPAPSRLPPRLQRLQVESRLPWAALGPIPPTVREVVAPLPTGIALRAHVAESGELLRSGQQRIVALARFLASLPEPPASFAVALEPRAPRAVRAPAPAQPSRWRLLPVWFSRTAAAGGGFGGAMPPPNFAPEPFPPIQPYPWQLLPPGSDEAAAAGGRSEAAPLPAPSHAPWLSALGGMRLRRLELKRIRLCAEDLGALATHMPLLEALSLALCELPAPSSLPLLAGLRRLQELELDCGGWFGGFSGEDWRRHDNRVPPLCVWEEACRGGAGEVERAAPLQGPPVVEGVVPYPHCAERGGGALPPGAAEGLLGLCVAAPGTLRRVRLGHSGCGRSGPALALGPLVREVQLQLAAFGRTGVEFAVGACGAESA
ncbi:hypothetical protein HYH03_018676 [Edaphochlamys debaryana]|uniref:Uncharacterized protein n=1 Tax=Edaphochlamys debaryana TaxID=47281 RepID=A0A836BMW2_9CHLO|nr:hypothetical protein HYH03_018676 [Edaphochlamys debaryana]|eukprot:KAG2482380.1 hypothetical protein HYH03_018676 [Edaphochlamys debaryana]